MVANVIIELAWIAATVVLVLTGHGGWAAATFIGAIYSGWTVKPKAEAPHAD
jgi:hypothetical protein